MNNNQINQENTYLALLNEAILDAQNLLTSFSDSNQVLSDFTTAFGDKYDRDTALSLVNQMTPSMVVGVAILSMVYLVQMLQYMKVNLKTSILLTTPITILGLFKTLIPVMGMKELIPW